MRGTVRCGTDMRNAEFVYQANPAFLMFMGIKKCDKCKDGYLIVKDKNGDVFYGCTNYNNPDVKCRRMIPLPDDPR